jgi:hypothetical protein
MTDRFDAQLRQHLLGTADERPAESQLTSIVEQVAVTTQRRPLVSRLPGLPVRIGPFPAVVRFGLIAVALVLAAMVGAILASGGPTAPSTPFEGTWTTIDRPDGSTMNLYVGAGPTPTVRFVDFHATGSVCRNDEVKVATAHGMGEVAGDRLEATFPNGVGCGLETVSIAGVYVYDPDADTLRDQDGLIWKRIPGGDGPPPSLPPGPSSFPVSMFEGRWTATDPGDGSALTLIVGEGTEPVVQFQDDLATGGVCDADELKIFRADGVGEIAGNRLEASYPDGGGCGSRLVPMAGRYDYDPDADTLTDQDNVTWTRVPAGDPVPTLRPAPSPPANANCVQFDAPGTYSAPAGSLSLRVSVAATAAAPWNGDPDRFFLMRASCTDLSGTGKTQAAEVTRVYTDACAGVSVAVDTAAEAIAAVSDAEAVEVVRQTDVTLGGYTGSRLDVVVPDIPNTCPDEQILVAQELDPFDRGVSYALYLVDVEGRTLALALFGNTDWRPAVTAQVDAIIASLQIERPS